MPDKQFTRTLSSCSMPYDTRHLIQVLGSGSWISSGPRIRSSTSEPRYMTWCPWGHYWMKRLILRWSALDKSGFSSANVCLPAVFLLPSYGDVRDWLILLTYVGSLTSLPTEVNVRPVSLIPKTATKTSTAIATIAPVITVTPTPALPLTTAVIALAATAAGAAGSESQECSF